MTFESKQIVLTLTLPDSLQAEREWICDVIFREFLGQVLNIEFSSVSAPEVTVCDQPGRLLLSDCFFAQARQRWLEPESLPSDQQGAINQEQLGGLESDVELPLPVLFGAVTEGKPFFTYDKGVGHLEIDVLGSAFFMLSRYEEVARPQADAHERFPARVSLAAKVGFLTRPIVDEYVEVLWAAIKKVWPGLTRKPHHGRTIVTCDVDVPYDHTRGSTAIFLRRLAGECLRRRSPREALRLMVEQGRHLCGQRVADKYDTFDWYLETCEKAGLRAHFYFLAGKTHPPTDARYNISEPFITNLLRMIGMRSHGIGLHGSYMTFRNPTQVARERENLEAACRSAGLQITIDTNRQHFLRWDAAQTPDHLEAAGIKIDSTGSFADRAGFRYGTARKFRMWSWIKNQGLALQQQPLIVMECSVIDARYQNLGYSAESLQFMLGLKSKALRYGDFTLLWHNSHLVTDKDRKLFAALLQSGPT